MKEQPITSPVEQIGVPAEKPTPVLKQIPSVVIVENAAGKSLEGTLLAKMGEEIVVRRASDNKLFLLELNALTPQSQTEMADFPDAEVEKLMQFKNPPLASVRTESTDRPPLGGGFSDDFDSALKRSSASGKSVMVVFLGENSAVNELLPENLSPSGET